MPESSKTDETDLPTSVLNSIKVINVGLVSFAEELGMVDVETVHVDWRPPAGGDAEMADILAELGA